MYLLTFEIIEDKLRTPVLKQLYMYNRDLCRWKNLDKLLLTL